MPLMARKSAPATEKPVRTLTENDLKRVAWRSIGPANMGGRVSDLCFEPGNPKAFLVAYATGGLWRTTNRGTTFEPIFDKEETSSIGGVAWVKKGEKDSVIWVGTGEGNGRNSSSWGNGMYKSTDGGKKWEHLGLEDSHDIPRIAVDPRDPDVLYLRATATAAGSARTARSC